MSGINHGSKQHMSATELKAIQRKKRKLQKEKEAATTAMEEEAQEGVRRNETFLIYNDNNNRTSDNNSNRRNTMNQSYRYGSSGVTSNSMQQSGNEDEYAEKIVSLIIASTNIKATVSTKIQMLEKKSKKIYSKKATL